MSRSTWLVLAVLLLGGVVGLSVWFDQAPAGPVQTDPRRPDAEATNGRRMELPGVVDTAAGTPAALELSSASELGDPSQAAPAGEALVGTRQVSGTVVRASDRTPLAGASVAADAEALSVKAPDQAQPSENRGPLVGELIVDSWRTGDDGLFSFAVPADSEWLHVGFHAARTAVELPAGSEPVEDLVLVVDSGFIVAGQVLDQQGSPIEGARVEIDGLSWPLARSGAGGGFTLRDVVVDPDRSHVDVRAQAPWYERGEAPVLVPSDVTTVARVEVHLVGAGALAGTVTDVEGRGVATDIVLSVHATDGHGSPHPGWLRAESDESGRYRVEGVPVGTWLVEVSGTELLAGRWLSGVDVTLGETTTLDVTLHAGAVLSGRVTDEAGTPISGASVILERIESWEAAGIEGTWITSRGDVHVVSSLDDGVGRTRLTREEARTQTDALGEYALYGLTAGTKRLTVSENASALTLAPVKRALTLDHELRLTDYDIVLPAGLVLRGIVVDEAGVAIEGVMLNVTRRLDHVLVDQGADTTGVDGRFEVLGLPAGELEVRVNADDWVEQHHELRAGGREQRFVLERAPRIEGLVRDARDGRPLTDFTVRLGRAGSWVTTRRRHDDGRFDLPVWDDLDYDVTVKVGGYVSETRSAVRPSATSGAPLIFELQPGS